MDPTLGTLIADKYRLDRVLGKGGMSTVYAACNQLTGKQVAIKLLQSESSGDDEHSLRLLREAQTASSIDHPNVVNVFDVGRHEGALFLVMELLHGEPLSALMLRGIGDPYEFVGLMMPVLRGVHAAHRAGVVHRDLKPDNILLCRDPHGEPREPKVLDFGISKLTDKLVRGQELTREGTVFGTPQYMAPEQMRDARLIDARCDVYALGVIFYRAFSGEYPYDADSIGALAIRIVEGKARPLHELCETLDPGLADVVMRALASDPERRFQSAAELREALAPYAAGRLSSPEGDLRESATQLRQPTLRSSAPGRLSAPPPPPRSHHGTSYLRSQTERPRASFVGSTSQAAVSSLGSVAALPRPSPAVALALESYRARLVEAPQLPTAAIELSELFEVAQPPPLVRARGDEPGDERVASVSAEPDSHVRTQLPKHSELEALPPARVDRRSPRQGLWVAALLLALGVLVPLLAQLWQGTSGAPAGAARASAGAKALGKTADVSALVKKPARAPDRPAAPSELAADPHKPIPHGTDVPLFTALGSGGRVDRAPQSTTEAVPLLLRERAEEPRASSVESERAAGASGQSELGPLQSGAASALSIDPGVPAKSEQRTLPVRREPFNPRVLERNPYMRR